MNIFSSNNNPTLNAKVVYVPTEDGQNFIINEFDNVAEHIENIKSSDVLGKTVTDAFPGVKEFGLFDVLHKVYQTGISAIHPIKLYKDDVRFGWRRNIIVKTGEKELTVWYEDAETLYKAHQSAEMFKQVLQFSSDAVAITDENAKIIYVNETFLKNTGYTEEELISANMNILKSGEHDQLFYQDMWITLQHYQVWEKDMINRHKSGIHYIDHTIIIPIYGEDKIITNYVTIKKDITDIRQKEQMFRTHIREAQMGEMVSIIAHQWRQPLAQLSASNNTLLISSALDKISPDTIERHCKEVENTIQFMSSTITDFRNFYSPSQKETEVYLINLINESIQLIHNAITNHNIIINIDIAKTLKIKVYKNEIKQVFLNLFKNFIDIVEERKILSPTIDISVKEEDQHIDILIEDNGRGIDSDILTKVFNAHFTTKEEKKGTGLGLYMCKLVIEEHCNGSISVENSNKGALFTIRLQKI